MPPTRSTVKRPSFDDPINYKRRNVIVTFAETPNAAPANTPVNALSNPPNCVAEADTDHSWQNMVPEANLSSWTYDRELCDRNKSLRQIYEDEGLDYGKDVSAAELRSRMTRAIKLRQASVANMFKIINSSRNIQLCFLVDVTESMSPDIEGIRDSILKIVEKLTAAGPGAIAKNVSLAFVGYRDFGYDNKFELQPFTENAVDFRQFCSTIETPGCNNSDAPEDVFGGLEKAITDLSWSDSMCTKIIFHIADNPCHGTKYHASDYPFTDRYPDGDPNGRTEEGLFNALRAKGIQYHFGKIEPDTDKMIELFSEAAGYQIEVFDIKGIEKLVDSVVSSVSIGTSILPTMSAKQNVFRIDRAVPDWPKLSIFKGVFLSFEMPETVIEVISDMSMTPKRPTKATIQISDNPFAHGSERKVFYGRDLSSNSPTDIVLKEYIKNNTDIASRNSAFPYEIATQMQTIAAYLASLFNDACLEKKIGITHDIKFLKVQMLSIEMKPGENRYMSCERRYGNDSKFLRFSNNADYEMLESTCKLNNLNFDVIELLMAFSHWTYQVSQGYLMVVDLQGVLSTDENGRTILELTDPAIHCTDLTRFGRTNMGPEGMKIFFSRHKCNKFCQGMELEEHETTTS